MQFVDEVTIDVRAGNGGHGLTSFRREKFIPKGGPDGGDGGAGGSVYLCASANLNHLGSFLHCRSFTADDGRGGRPRHSTGGDGADLCIAVPPGTVVYDVQTKERIGELLVPDASLLVARGGRRGLGNPHFRNATNRAPQRSTRGTPGEARALRLELRLIAEVGLVGRPNAGKSSLLNCLTRAQARVGDYMFTTVNPVLGVVRSQYDSDHLGYTLADIPGLIDGASRGEGLGFFFLRHVLRTHLLLHLADVTAPDLFADIEEVERNLFEYDPRLRDHPRWLVLSKCDKPAGETVLARAQRVRQRYGLPCYTTSALTSDGAQELTDAVARFLSARGQQ